MSDFLLIAPELVLTVGGLVLLMLAAFFGDKQAAVVNALGALILAGAIIAVASLTGVSESAFSGTLRIDAFGSYAKYLVYGAAIVALLMAPRFFTAQGYRAEYPVLIIFAALGMGIMVSAHDLMSLYIGLELNSLAAYVLASFMRTDSRSYFTGPGFLNIAGPHL